MSPLYEQGQTEPPGSHDPTRCSRSGFPKCSLVAKYRHHREYGHAHFYRVQPPSGCEVAHTYDCARTFSGVGIGLWVLHELADMVFDPLSKPIGRDAVVFGDVVLDLDQILPGRRGVLDPDPDASAAR